MIVRIRDFDHWRQVARRLIQQDVLPGEVTLREEDDQPSLFEDACDVEPFASIACESAKPFTVPRAFLELAQDVAYHRKANRWNTLYRTLWRLKNQQPHLLELTTDDDVYELRRMEKQVRRDAHKTKAFVRFRKVVRDDTEHFIAWHRPDHYVLRKVGPLFSRRFQAMHWSIFTPYESAIWDRQTLHYGPGIAQSEAPGADELEELWRTYYASIFNPARVKVKSMKNEMPVRYWPTMPETELIPDLLRSAPKRVEQMIAVCEGYDTTVAAFIARHENEHRPIRSLAELKSLAAECTCCDLHCHATQTVFGEGPATAKIVMVGEQPGDMEDQSGRPFVGPAGRVLDEALLAAGIDRRDVYLTNIVKHFKHEVQEGLHPREMRGKRRLHKRPNASEVRACKPWLHAEWQLLKQATVVVCLGSTAATSIIAPEFKIQRERGRRVASTLSANTIASWHPSAILRAPSNEVRDRRMTELIFDLQTAYGLILDVTDL